MYYLLLLLILVPLIIWFDNKLKKDWLTLLVGLIITPLIIQNVNDLLALIIAMILGYASDFMGVKLDSWRYRKKYSYWVGYYWGIIAVLVIKSSSYTTAPILFLIALLIDAKHGNRAVYKIPISWIYLIITLIFMRNQLDVFMTCMFASTYIEYLGTKTKNWVYAFKPNFVMLGFGYCIVIYLSSLAIKPAIDLVSIILVAMLMSYFPIRTLLDRPKARKLIKTNS